MYNYKIIGGFEMRYLKWVLLTLYLFTFPLYASEVDPQYPVYADESAYTNNEQLDSQKIWPYPLPFMAQKVIDMGFELPYPFGLTLIYAHVDQELLLDNLNVGFAGNPKNNLDEYVQLNNAFAVNDTVQLKADAWIFPFMNVFAFIGTISGDAKLDIDLDFGLGSGDVCNPSGPRPPPSICSELGGKRFHVDTISYDGYNIGIGTVFAAGWKEWFLAIPLSYTWSDLDIMKSTVEAVNFTPRAGYSIDLKKYGKIYPFVGATYLDVDMTIEGEILSTDGTTLVDYDLHQENKDKWNALVGFNWDFSKKWSWNLEVGFLGSRNNVITGMTYRY